MNSFDGRKRKVVSYFRSLDCASCGACDRARGNASACGVSAPLLIPDVACCIRLNSWCRSWRMQGMGGIRARPGTKHCMQGLLHPHPTPASPCTKRFQGGHAAPAAWGVIAAEMSLCVTGMRLSYAVTQDLVVHLISRGFRQWCRW